MLTINEEYFLRSSLLLLKGCGYVFIQVLQRVVQEEKRKSGKDIDSILKINQTKLNFKFPSLEQRHKLIPPNGKTQVETWDIAMISIVLLTCYRSFLVKEEVEAIKTIKGHRNDVHAHIKAASLSLEEYRTVSLEVVNAINELSKSFDKDIKNESSAIVTDCLQGDLDMKTHRNALAQIADTDALFQEILNKVNGLREDLTSIVRQAVLSALKEGRKLRTIKVIDSELEVSGKDVDEIYIDLAEEIITTVTNEAIRRVESADKFREIREAIQDILLEIEQHGVHAIQAGKMCVLIKLECGSIKEILYLLELRYDTRMVELLGMLASSLRDYLHLPTAPCLKFGISERSLHAILEELEPSLASTIIAHGRETSPPSKELQAKSDEAIYTRRVHLPLQCESLEGILHIHSFFENGGAMSGFNKLSVALSKHLGKEVHIKGSLNKAQIKQCLEQTKPPSNIGRYIDSQRMNFENWTEFIPTFTSKIKEAFEKNGVIGVSKCVAENLDEWKSMPLNVAVIGSTGVGKSSFINTVLNLKADEEGAAMVDVVQCTMEPTEYSHKEYPNLKIWDLPGAGTRDFPRERYLETIRFERYDYFIILSATRFTQDDIWLAKTLHENDKGYYFVRTKIDIDIASFKVSHRQQVDKTTVVGRIKTSCIKGLADEGLPQQNVYIVANYAPNGYDFDSLCTSLFRDAPEIKREAMAMTFSVMTEGVIMAKADVMKGRINKVALASAVGSAIPLPGLGLAVDITAIIEEAIHYRKAFGLNDENLKRVAAKLQVSLNDLNASMDLKSTAITLTVKGLASFCQTMLLTEAVENVAKYGIPVVGSFIAGAVSYWSTGKCLEKMLKLMVDDALKINRRLKEMLESMPV